MNQITTQQAGQAVAARPQGRVKFDLMDPVAFSHIQRVAGMYANSPLFPEHLRKGGGQTAIANAVLVLNIAERLNEDALTVAQNIYFVSGRAGWNATYMIAKANQHGVFKNPIEWRVEGEGEELSVTAYATLAGTGKKVEKTITFETAKKDGWTRNAKYLSMPETMLQYRSATALIRLYCPEVMIGMPVSTEIEDEAAAMRDITPMDHAQQPAEEVAAITSDLGIEAIEDPAPAKEEATTKPVNRERPKPATAPADEAETIDEETGEVTKVDEKGEVKGEPEPQNMQPIFDSILNDLTETGNPDAVLTFYKDQVAKMKKEAPKLHGKLMAEIEAFKAADETQE